MGVSLLITYILGNVWIRANWLCRRGCVYYNVTLDTQQHSKWYREFSSYSKELRNRKFDVSPTMWGAVGVWHPWNSGCHAWTYRLNVLWGFFWWWLCWWSRCRSQKEQARLWHWKSHFAELFREINTFPIPLIFMSAFSGVSVGLYTRAKARLIVFSDDLSPFHSSFPELDLNFIYHQSLNSFCVPERSYWK